MSRVLFVVSPERGHINPCIGPAEILRKGKHTVAFYTAYNVSERLKRAGFDKFYSTKQESPPPVTANRAKYFAENVKDREWARFSLKTTYLDRVTAQVEPLRQAIRDFKPSVLAVDPKVYEGAIASELEGIPWLTMTASLTIVSPDFLSSELNDTVKWFEDDRKALFQSFGVEGKFRFTDILSPNMNLCFATDELLGSITMPNVKRIGPSIPTGDRGDECDFPWSKLDDHVPVIYAFFGSQTFYQPGIIRSLIESVKDHGVQLVCSVSELYDSLKLEYIPQNVLLIKDAPQLNLLAGMAAFISHGGASSTMEAMSCGVPMLVSPIYDDQSHQAYFIDKSSVGQRHDLSKMGPEEIWRAIQFVMQSPRVKESVEKVKLSYKKFDGAQEAARQLIRLAEKGS